MQTDDKNAKIRISFILSLPNAIVDNTDAAEGKMLNQSFHVKTDDRTYAINVESDETTRALYEAILKAMANVSE